MQILLTDSIKPLLENLDPSQPLMFDCETGGPNYKLWIMAQFYQEGWPYVIELDMQKVNPTIVWDIIQPYYLVGHNLNYDFHVAKSHVEGFRLPDKWDDTFYASRLLFPQWQKYTLDSCLTKVLGYDPYEKAGITKSEMQKSFKPSSFTEHQKVYAAIDVYELPKLYDVCKSMFDKPTFLYKLDKLTTEHALDMNNVGMPIDLEKLSEMEESDRQLIKEYTQKYFPPGFNYNSYLQVRKLLGLEKKSDEEGLAIIMSRPNGLEGYQRWDKGKMRLVEPNYKHSPEKADLARKLIEVKKADKRLQFAKRARAWMQFDKYGIPRITARFSPHAITGRVQPSDENLSQYPRSMKAMWGVPKDSGRVLIYADFSQLELRSICAILPERNMEKAYRNKIDLHTYAAQNLNVDTSKMSEGITPRFVAKQLNFLALYGGGVDNFQATVCKLTHIWIPTDVCKTAFAQWKQGFSDIKAWHERNAKSRTKLDKTVSGRPYKAKTYTDLNNIKNQGSGAEVAKLALHYMFKYGVVSKDKDIHMVNFVHDAYVIDAPDNPDIYKQTARGVGLCMNKAWFEVMKQAPIKDLPMPVDVLVGYNWHDLDEEIEEAIIYSTTIDGMYMFDKQLEKEL